MLIAFANAFENVSKISRDRAGRWRLWPEGRQRRCALKLLLRMTLQVKGPLRKQRDLLQNDHLIVPRSQNGRLWIECNVICWRPSGDDFCHPSSGSSAFRTYFATLDHHLGHISKLFFFWALLMFSQLGPLLSSKSISKNFKYPR